MRRRSGLASRLLAAQLLVIAVGALTLGAVDSLVGPPLFRSHVREALGDLPAGVAGHLQEALLTAGGIYSVGPLTLQLSDGPLDPARLVKGMSALTLWGMGMSRPTRTGSPSDARVPAIARAGDGPHSLPLDSSAGSP